MKLTDREAEAILSCEMRARESVALVSRKVKLPSHSVRYHIRNLEKRGVIRYMPLINIFRLGYSRITMYASLDSAPLDRIQIINWLVDQSCVVWVGELGPDVHLGIGLCVKGPGELQAFQHRFTERFPGVISAKSISTQFSATFLPHSYLAGIPIQRNSLLLSANCNQANIDKLDIAILQAMTQSGFRSHRRLAAQIGIPGSTLELRVSGLIQQRVIEGFIYRVFPEKYGMHSYTILLNTRGASRDITTKLKSFCAAEPSVVLFIESLGAWDYEINIDVADAEQSKVVLKKALSLLDNVLAEAKLLRRERDWKDHLFPVSREETDLSLG